MLFLKRLLTEDRDTAKGAACGANSLVPWGPKTICFLKIKYAPYISGKHINSVSYVTGFCSYRVSELFPRHLVQILVNYTLISVSILIVN